MDGVDSLIEHWDGNSWTIVTSPNGVGGVQNILYGVTCSSTQCWAVGLSYNGNTVQTLIERLDGTSWALATSPNPSVRANILTGVTCVSDSDCWIVGSYYNDTAYQTLVAHWDGASWLTFPSANTGTKDNVLLSATCASSSDCWTVGYFKDASLVYHGLIQHWNGTLWSVATSPPPPTQSNVVVSVTCTSASNCWAVGRIATPRLPDGSGPYDQTLIERWDGTVWTIVNSPNSSTTAVNGLTGIACASASHCSAVGFRGQQFYYDQTLTERWDGSSWNIVPSQNRRPTETKNFFTDVTCLSTSECWSVGRYQGDGLVDQTLIEYWNGVSWSIVPSANTSGADYNLLSSVACVSSSDCWAVGEYSPPVSNPSTLTEHWNGTAWSVVSSPNTTVNTVTSNNGNHLNGVACTSGSACWAVGYAYAGLAAVQTLIERWDGASWTIAPSPNASAVKSLLEGVTCVSESDCWAVGSSYNDFFHQTLIEHWNGVVWNLVVSPNSSPTLDNVLVSVTCGSSSDCWSVGNFKDASGIYQTLIEHWDGLSWTIATSPRVNGSGGDVLTGVTCASVSECWAVGYYYDSSLSVDRTLIERWDGSAWVIVTSANATSAQPNVLEAVTCPSASHCWAVGYYNNGRVWQALTEFITPLQPVEVVSRKTHGSAGPFDVDLANGNGIECRSGGANGDYTLVFTFANPLTSVGGVTISSGTAGVKSSVIGSDPHQYIVDLTGVTNAQRVVISLNNVQDVAANFSGTVAATFRLLIGDTTADNFANSTDIAQTKSQSGTTVINSNYREDLNADGSINSADIALVKSKSGTALP
jgi:hypothetical protein